jgi:hypothetical protein
VFVEFNEVNHTTERRPYVEEYPSYAFSGEWAMWHRTHELIAFRYELVRRISFPELPEWHSVPRWLSGYINGLLTPDPQRAVAAHFHPVAPPNYAKFDWMWDLEASDEALCRSFIQQINEQRRKVGLPDTNDPLIDKTDGQGHKRRGQRNRQVSWLAVEALDIQSFKVRALTDGERSSVSKAKREAAAFADKMHEVITRARELTPKDEQTATNESVYVRFLKENLKRHIASKLNRK